MKLKLFTNFPNFDILDKKTGRYFSTALIRSENSDYWLKTDFPNDFESNFLPCCNMNKVHYKNKEPAWSRIYIKRRQSII